MLFIKYMNTIIIGCIRLKPCFENEITTVSYRDLPSLKNQICYREFLIVYRTKHYLLFKV